VTEAGNVSCGSPYSAVATRSEEEEDEDGKESQPLSPAHLRMKRGIPTTAASWEQHRFSGLCRVGGCSLGLPLPESLPQD
jgi:hypothetical protein